MSFLSAFAQAMVPSVIQAAGSGAKAGGQIAAGQEAAAVGNYNDQVEQQNARQAIAAGQSNAAVEDQNVATTTGQAVANYGLAGVLMSGSPLAVMASIQSQGQLQKRLIMYDAATKAQADVQQGNLQAAQGQADQTAGYTKAAGTLLTGAGTFYQAASAMAGSGGAGTSPAK